MPPLKATSLSFTTMIVSAAIGWAAAVGCVAGPSSNLGPAMHGPGVSADGAERTAGDNEPKASGEAGAPMAEGLPCDVATVLAESCTDCHGTHPSGGAPMSLVTYDDLVAPWDEDPSRTIADVALERMTAMGSPMPPDGPVAASDVAVVATWVGAGMPRGSCNSHAALPDAGPPSGVIDGGLVMDAAPIDTSASVCTSGTLWTPGTPGSALMAPGNRCNACHAATGGPSLTLAGTVYPTLHEPDNCNGAGARLTVVIVDAAGKSHALTVNAAGNFTRVTAIPMPYTARVVNGTKVREMKTPQTDGDCNGCHSESGTHAPGRIMAP